MFLLMQLNSLAKTPIVIIVGFYFSGIIINNYFDIPFFIWWISIASLLLNTLIFKNHKNADLLILSLFLCLGGLNHSKIMETGASHLQNFSSEQEHQISGFVEKCDLKNNKTQITLKQISIKNNKFYPFKGKILLTIKNTQLIFLYGDIVEFTGKIIIPSGRRNPGEFDYKKYLQNNDIFALVYLDKNNIPHILEKKYFSLRRIANIVKLKIEEIIDKSTYGDQNAILKALIIGMRGDITPETKQAFIDSGIIHVLAVSGLHVGYVTLVFYVIFGLLRFPPKTRTILTIITLFFYACIVDFKPSVVRAVIMASMVLFGKAFEKRSNIYNSLATAALIQTLVSPLQIFDIGFQLSFTAVFSIIYIYKNLNQKLDKLSKFDFNNKFVEGIKQLFLVSLSALLGTLPLTIYYFNRIPVISLLTNLFAIPLVGLIAALGFAQVILGYFSDIINICYGEIQMILIGFLEFLTKFTSRLPFAYFNIKSISINMVIYLYLLLFAILNIEKTKIKKYLLFGIMISLNVMVWKNVFTEPKLKITFFDVHQGDAIFFQFPKGKNMLIDTGDRTFRKNYAKLVILPYLQREGIDQIDILCLTHPHNDHIGGAPLLLKNLGINEIWEADIVAASKTYKEIHVLIDSLQIPIKKLHAGDVINFSKDIKLFCLHPSNIFLDQKSNNYNDYSTVFKLSHKDIDILLTGDAEYKSEEYVSLWADFLNSEILKVPHHGSKTSSTEHFISYIKPEIAIISVGKGNKFKHPSKKIISRYKKLGTQIHRTDQDHALVIESDGINYEIINYQ